MAYTALGQSYEIQADKSNSGYAISATASSEERLYLRVASGFQAELHLRKISFLFHSLKTELVCAPQHSSARIITYARHSAPIDLAQNSLSNCNV